MRHTVEQLDADGRLEPLLGGLTGPAREARLALVSSLLDDGFDVDELTTAAEQHRLVLLPMERILSDTGPLATPAEAARRAGVPVDHVARLREALGLALVEPDERALTAGDVEAMELAAAALAAGLPLESVLEVNTALAAAMPGLASTLRDIAVRTVIPGSAAPDDERGAALALARAATDLLPLVMPVLEYALRAHVQQQVTRDFVVSELGQYPGSAPERSVAFADLEGFTRLSETSDADTVGALSGRLAVAARSVAHGRVRLVKTIGDAVLMVAPTPAELVPAVLALIDTASRLGLPRLRAGTAHGEVLQRAGDVFGRPVNRASRLTGLAEPGALLVDAAVHGGLDGVEGLAVEELAPVTLRGVEGPQPVWRVRPSGDGAARSRRS